MSSNKKQRLSVLWQIDSLSDTHCKPCDVRSVNEGCQECPIGIRIKELGNSLYKVKEGSFDASRILSKGQDMTKNEIELLLKRNINKKDIMKSLKMGTYQFYDMLEAWGLYKSKKTKGESRLKQSKGNMDEAKRLLAETDLDVKEIARKTGTNENTLKVYSSKIRKKQTNKLAEIGQDKPLQSDKEKEYNSLITELTTKLQDRDELVTQLQETIKKYEETPKYDPKDAYEKIEQMESACADVEQELAAEKEIKEKLQAEYRELAYQFDASEHEKEKAVDEIMELRSKNATALRELKIAEENLTAANKSLRNKDAALEQLERELSYARENEQTLRQNDAIFKAALKAVL